MIKLKKTKAGMVVSGIYLGISLIAFLTHIMSVETNPADSGLSAIWFYLCSLPWLKILMDLLPQDFFYTRTWGLLTYPVGWCCILLNAFILYCLSGGIKLVKSIKEQ